MRAGPARGTLRRSGGAASPSRGGVAATPVQRARHELPLATSSSLLKALSCARRACTASAARSIAPKDLEALRCRSRCHQPRPSKAARYLRSRRQDVPRPESRLEMPETAA